MESPRIRTIGWVDASGVLGHEERGFSTWLANNLDLLGDALDLTGLTLVERESGVGGYRVDILAVADDGTDEGIPVVIENQYGGSNHDHLGKLVTYLAKQQRGLGVWIVERYSEPHLAAVDFLNRTSNETVGYALVVVKFAPAPNGEHYVDFRVAARPNLWVQAEAGPVSHASMPERVDLLAAVHALVEGPLLEAGWQRVSFYGPRAARIELRLPDSHPLRRHGYFTLRASRDAFRFRHVLTDFASLDASRAVVTGLRDRYGERLAEAVPAGTNIEWDVEVRSTQRNAQWFAEHPGGGHADLDAETAAEWAISVAGAWARLLINEPPHDLVAAASATGTG